MPEKKVLSTSEFDAVNFFRYYFLLRLETDGSYNPVEDEFKADTFFSHNPQAEEEAIIVRTSQGGQFRPAFEK